MEFNPASNLVATVLTNAMSLQAFFSCTFIYLLSDKLALRVRYKTMQPQGLKLLLKPKVRHCTWPSTTRV